METKIDELAKKAGFSLNEDGHGIAKNGRLLNIQKFAELIIKECGEIADDLAGCSMGGANSFDLMKHFGIKEKKSNKGKVSITQS